MSNKNIPIKAGAWGKYRSGVVLGGWLIRRIELLDSHHWLQLPNYKKLPYIRLHPSPNPDTETYAKLHFLNKWSF